MPVCLSVQDAQVSERPASCFPSAKSKVSPPQQLKSATARQQQTAKSPRSNNKKQQLNTHKNKNKNTHTKNATLAVCGTVSLKV